MVGVRGGVSAKEDWRQAMSEALRTAARELLDHDGGETSQDYGAAKYLKARRALEAALSESAGPTKNIPHGSTAAWLLDNYANIRGKWQMLIPILNAYGKYVLNSRTAPYKEVLVQHMVNRFLQWRLPENFNPDGGISFKKTFNENTPHPMKHEPVGTNLLDATQAEEMVRYMLAESPSESAPDAVVDANKEMEKEEKPSDYESGMGRDKRSDVIGAKPLCLDCHLAGIINCAHFDECNGKWVYVAHPTSEAKDLQAQARAKAFGDV